MQEALPENIVFFDGVCNFCNYWVNFALKRNKKNNLFFSPLQGETADRVLPPAITGGTGNSSILFLQNGKLYTHSLAVLQLSRQLRRGWPLLYGLRIVPRFLRDGIYRFIARNRYRWFGKREACMVPKPEWQHRFLP